MATSIPLGYHIWSATFTCAGSTHNVVSTCGGRNAGFLTAASIENAWRSSAVGAGSILVPASMAVGWTLVETKILANIGGLVTAAANMTPVVGSATTNPQAMNSALKVTKDTGFVGRPYQARFMWPPFVTEANVDAAGNITGGLAVIQNFWTTFYGNLQTALIDPVVIHNPVTGLVPTKINSFTVKSRIGTIGRRMRR